MRTMAEHFAGNVPAGAMSSRRRPGSILRFIRAQGELDYLKMDSGLRRNDTVFGGHASIANAPQGGRWAGAARFNQFRASGGKQDEKPRRNYQ